MHPAAPSNDPTVRFLFDLPYDPGEVIGDPILLPARETRLQVPLRRDGRSLIGELEFGWTRSYVYTTEPLCTPFQLEAYERVVEVEDSPWIADLVRDRQGTVVHIDLAHFMVYLADAGCFEFAAETWTYREVADDR